MARKTLIAVVVLLVALGLLYWYQQSREDNDASANVLQSVSVFNQTQNQDGTAVTAAPNDTLVYTLTVANTSDETISGYVVETSIDDVSELATLTDAAGANYNAANNSLMWTPLDIAANESIQKQFTVRIKDSLPTDSDLAMTTAYGGQVTVSVSRTAIVANPAPAPSPSPASYAAPTAGPSLWFAVLLSLLFTSGLILYKAARSIKA